MTDIRHKKLIEIVLHLQQIHSTITVAVAALKQQGCELDEDIANVLRRGAADKTQDLIETIEHLLGE